SEPGSCGADAMTTAPLLACHECDLLQREAPLPHNGVLRCCRWSMLDIYVITMLVALVQFKALATIQAGPAAIAFGSVVVLTMFAAMSFDPRLIWDLAGKNHVQAAR
ncbi:paraquat-inducible protein A, partial [Paraburkholderia panacisoli]|uniref:paraquat-inducible protein A n=1 Tax=Paraburkholderia panacisoli TaxID=2603818 RepID=UPI001FE70B35